MLWQRWVGRFLQVGAAIGTMLTLVEWVSRGGTHVRAGRILLGAAIAGVGLTLNVPLEAGATDADHAVVWNAVIDPALVRFAPDLIVVSAGFDGHQDDPLGSQRMTTSGYRVWLAAIRARAEQTCGGRLAVVTEGGYDLIALRACLDATVDVLHGPVAQDSEWRDAGGPDRRGRDVEQALQSHPLVASGG